MPTRSATSWSGFVPVHRVVDMTKTAAEYGHDRPLERELALVKVAGTGDARVEALRLAEAFRANVIGRQYRAFRLRTDGGGFPRSSSSFAIMKPLGLVGGLPHRGGVGRRSTADRRGCRRALISPPAKKDRLRLDRPFDPAGRSPFPANRSLSLT